METSPLSDLSVIVVNYNAADFLVRCLNSIASQTQIDSEVIVVDNASQDNSLDLIRNNFPWVILIANEHNLGFARANNLALKTCRANYVYFLNPDTEVLERCFRNMIDFMDQHPEIGLAGTRIVNPDGSPQSSIEKRYPGEKYAKQELRDLKGNLAWVMGASMIARRGIVEDLGGFDEEFFLYGEEQDLCLRIRRAGWAIGYINEAAVVHWGGQSERENLPAEVWKKKFDAEFTFYRKHYSKRAIRGIKQANLIKAFWRILTLKLTLPFCSDKDASLKKLEKYRLVLKAFGTRNI